MKGVSHQRAKLPQLLLIVSELVIGSVIALRDGRSGFLLQPAVLFEFGLRDPIRRNVEGNSMRERIAKVINAFKPWLSTIKIRTELFRRGDAEYRIL